MAPRIIEAHTDKEGFITATVAFDDGLNQSVRLPGWANKKNIKDEAVRLRTEAEAAQQAKQERTDLVD